MKKLELFEVERICKMVAALTECNDHTGALRESTKLIEDDDVRKVMYRKFDAICLLVALEGEIPPGLDQYRRSLYLNLKKYLGSTLTPNRYEMWNKSL